ncbi:MAG: hypothetical protein N2999_03525 [Proteobacteria bacterium]|nr:hypothetical protein [Pseudomonadota bacterium]
MEVVKEYKLDNGLTLKLFDKTYRYFGEYFFIEIEAVCEIPISLIDKKKLPQELVPLIPEKLIYSKTLSKKGVYESKVKEEKDHLIENFERNSLPYLDNESFPFKFYLKELQKIKRKKEIEELRRKLSEGKDTTAF